MPRSRPPFGLAAKIVVFLTAMLVPLAAITWFVSVQILRQRMTEEFASKGTATVQTETQEAVIAMEEGTREVEAGCQETVRAEAHLMAIAGLSTSSAELAQGISRTSARQADGVEGTARAMHAIARVSIDTEQAVLQTRRSLEDLVKLADELTRSRSRFTLAAA